MWSRSSLGIVGTVIFLLFQIKNCKINSENNIKYCLLERAMFLDEKFEKRLVTMLLKTDESSKDVLLTIISPLGTLIPKGVKISLDNEKLFERK